MILRLTCRSVYKLCAAADSYTALHAELAAHPERWEEDMHKTFRFDVTSINQKSSSTRNRAVITAFQHMGLKGKAVMKEAQAEFLVIEDCELLI